MTYALITLGSIVLIAVILAGIFPPPPTKPA